MNFATVSCSGTNNKRQYEFSNPLLRKIHQLRKRIRKSYSGSNREREREMKVTKCEKKNTLRRKEETNDRI